MSSPPPPSNVTTAVPSTPMPVANVSSPPRRGDRVHVARRVGVEHLRPRADAGDAGHAGLERVRPLGPASRERVRRGVAAEVGLDHVERGAGRVLDGDRVGAAERLQRDLLDRRRGPCRCWRCCGSSRTREPFADTLMISPMSLPLNETASLPPWPSTVSLWSPGMPDGSDRCPSRAGSCRRRSCRRRCRCRLPPISVSRSGAADQRVVAGAAVDGDRLVDDGARRSDRSRTSSSPSPAVTHDRR